MKCRNQGFTLLEILIVVLIIGVLVAVALPQYQKAVLKSRYSALMATTKSMADSNEAYYLEHGQYAEGPQNLPLEGKNNYPDGTELTFGTSPEYAYVLSTNKNSLPNNTYIIYQRHSANFPGEIHCEALKEDKLATWLCQDALKGKRIPGSLTEGFATYVLQGTGQGLAYGTAQNLEHVVCDAHELSGNRSCEIDRSADNVVKTVCTNKDDPNTCTYHVYDKDANHWECYAKNSKLANGACVPTATGAYAHMYDEDGNKVSLECDNFNQTNQACTQWTTRTYNALETKIESDRRECAQWDERGNCTAYKQNAGYDSFGTLNDAQSFTGNPGFGEGAGSLNYANTTTNWAQLNCATVNSAGECTSYKNGYFDTTTWNENKQGTSFERVNCSVVTPQGKCETISSWQTAEVTYTDSGKVETKTFRTCLERDAAGSCTKYSQNDKNNNYQESYNYDSNNNKTSYTRYRCAAVTNADSCDTYATSFQTTYTYNAANRPTSEINVGCNAYDANNHCTEYDRNTNTYNTYASNGKTQTSRTTTQCNSYTGLVCTGGWTVTTTPYVNGKADNNNKVTNSNCSNVNMETGACLD